MVDKLIKLLIYMVIPWIIMVPIYLLDGISGTRLTPVIQLFCVLVDGCIITFYVVWLIVKKIGELQ